MNKVVEPVATATLKEVSHTRGPWIWCKHANNLDYQIMSPSGDAELGTWMVADKVRWEGNARLIAAAPELLAALAELAEGLWQDDVPQPGSMHERVQAAILKATSSSSPKGGSSND